MLSLFKRESPDRRAMRLGFEGVIRQLRGADALTQKAVGHSINMANSLFLQRFTTASFQALPSNEQLDYIHSLSAMETRLQAELFDPTASLGFGLFKMWVGAVMAKDEPLIAQISKELAYFSKLGEFYPEPR